MSLNRLLVLLAVAGVVLYFGALIFIALAPYLIGAAVLWLLWRTTFRPMLTGEMDDHITISVKPPPRVRPTRRFDHL
jgi:UDP-N-acetylmuramyl pentapeptide phosphotransferase/UDP-N-acetylglucosamine-1-phosphate transferase